MRKFSKPFIIAGATAAIGLAGLGVGTIHAATSTTTDSGPFAGLVSAIATKFNLNPTDVQAVVTQVQQTNDASREADMAAHLKTMLDTAVTKGTITQAQEDLLIAKQKEVETFEQSLQGKTSTDRETAVTAEETTLKQWATDNNIPTQFIPRVGGHGGFGGHGRGGPDGDMAPPAGAPTSTN